MLPGDYLKPCLAALSELVTNYHSSVVLCTATQPAINNYIPNRLTPVELTDDPKALYQKFKRVRCKFIGETTDNDLVERLAKEEQVLCIVNSRRHAKLLYDRLGNLEGTFHLSARMCPIHRHDKLSVIKDALVNGKHCRVVSTQLIEAGVDIDFPAVFRALSGLDSIAQAAGRCNREGKLDVGTVNVFSPEKHGMPGGWLRRTAEIARMVMQDFEDPLCLEAVTKYFEVLYGIDEALLDRKTIISSLREEENRLGFPFAEVANKFNFIDSDMVSVIIPWDDRCKLLLEDIRHSSHPGRYGRKLQPYVVQVYWFEYQALVHDGAIEDIAGIFKVLLSSDHYSIETGLVIPKGVRCEDKVLIF
jgi:CRISPR-associated endonuclease/helicase Cas3